MNNMIFGFYLLISAIIGSLAFLMRDFIRESIIGLWLRASREINIGTYIKIRAKGKTYYEGTILSFGFRNTAIGTQGGIVYIENSKIFSHEVEVKTESKEAKPF